MSKLLFFRVQAAIFNAFYKLNALNDQTKYHFIYTYNIEFLCTAASVPFSR